MRVAIMQPYFFPYIGYFQLINAVDKFVIYDDVHFIKRGWINRNRILVQGKQHLITLDLEKASQNRLISEIRIKGEKIPKILRTIEINYVRAPEFKQVMPLVKATLLQDERRLSHYLTRQLRMICDYLDLHVNWEFSSKIPKNPSLKGEEKVLAICEYFGASHYINPPGGRSLYNPEHFRRRGIRLSFLQPRPINYRQFGNEFVPNLSIIDVMMFNNRKECQRLLKECDLV